MAWGQAAVRTRALAMWLTASRCRVASAAASSGGALGLAGGHDQAQNVVVHLGADAGEQQPVAGEGVVRGCGRRPGAQPPIRKSGALSAAHAEQIISVR